MKLLTSSGLLFAAANSAATTADGHYGAYPMVDWSAIFNEAALPAVSNVYNNASVNTIGLAPAVTGLITTYDGGKLMCGYSGFDGATTFGWVFKLWGEKGTATNCGSSSTATGVRPAGHVVFTTAVFNVAATSTCTTKTQWTWVEPGSSVADMAFGSVYLAVAEDYVKGVADIVATPTAAPYYYVGGGISALASYGLGMYSQFLFGLEFDGTLYTGMTGEDTDGYAEITHYNGAQGTSSTDNYGS